MIIKKKIPQSFSSADGFPIMAGDLVEDTRYGTLHSVVAVVTREDRDGHRFYGADEVLETEPPPTHGRGRLSYHYKVILTGEGGSR